MHNLETLKEILVSPEKKEKMDPVEYKIVEIFNSYSKARQFRKRKITINNLKPKHNQKIFFNVEKIEREEKEKNISDFDKISTFLESKKSDSAIQINLNTRNNEEEFKKEVICKLEKMSSLNHYFINNICNFEFSFQKIIGEIHMHLAQIK